MDRLCVRIQQRALHTIRHNNVIAESTGDFWPWKVSPHLLSIMEIFFYLYSFNVSVTNREKNCIYKTGYLNMEKCCVKKDKNIKIIYTIYIYIML